jgi:hypothetical protein
LAILFKDKPKLGLGYLESDAAQISEVFKRRNLIVHNGGKVSRRYLDEVEEEFHATAKLGERIEVDPEYLQKAIDVFEKSFILLCAELWKKLLPSDETRALLNRLAMSHLIAGRWEMARGFSIFLMGDKNQSEYVRLCAEINYWQSFKWSGNYSEISGEVEKADFSAKGILFQLAKAAIVGNHTDFLKKLPKALDTGELSTESLKEWPLFQEVRKLPEIEAMLKITGEPPANS